MAELSGQYPLTILLGLANLSRSSYYYACRHPKQPTRPELQDSVKKMFSRTANGCGHRQIAMCLRAELGVSISKKTVLKIMHEQGIKCSIRRKGFRPYSSYKGMVGQTFTNVINRDFNADKPWQKMGTDVTEFSQPWGKAYFAPVYDFASKEIVAWTLSKSPTMAQQRTLLKQMLRKMPRDSHPVLHSDRGWQYQHTEWCKRLEKAGIVQSMSRKGNCLDNAATEQVFGHLKDEFFRGRTWNNYQTFKRDLDSYINHWNTKRRQIKLNGLTPEEFRNHTITI